MDPNAAYRELRFNPGLGDRAAAAESLSDWLAKGGFLPDGAARHVIDRMVDATLSAERERMEAAVDAAHGEVFKRSAAENESDGWVDGDGEPLGPGWFYWCCLPGCMPEGEAIGPFETAAEAYADAYESWGLYDQADDDGSRDWVDGSGCVNIERIPAEAIEDCSGPGDASEMVGYWVGKLGFTVPHDRAVTYLQGTGGWVDDDPAGWDQDRIDRTVFWLACCDVRESLASGEEPLVCLE